jgi:glycine cleavage system aminomethyltransferase T
MIGDGVVVALEDDEFEVLAIPVNTDWLQFHAQRGGYDVQVTDDPPTGMNTKERRFYRFQVQGPFAIELLEKAMGGRVPDVKFFHVGEFEIGGLNVRAISHNMVRAKGFELFGPRADGPRILEVLRRAGRSFGMRETGATSLPTSYEGGWVGLQVPAIYSGDDMKPFREWVSEYSFEGFASLGGSFDSPDIEDYYVTPWDIGYGHLIKFDHDFIGRAALEKMAVRPAPRQKVFLRWDEEDCARAVASALVGKGPRTKLLGVPIAVYSTFPNDQVLVGDQRVGISIIGGYSVNVGSWLSLATIESKYAVDGTQVEVLWGDADTSQRPLAVEPHVLTRIKASVSTKAPVR